MAAANASRAGGATGLNPGTYRDGSSLDGLHYLQCKLILKPDRCNSAKDFHEYGTIVRQVAHQCDVGISAKHVLQLRPRIREVVFFDTPDFRLYNNAFILRRRLSYEDGFPVGDPEIVFKFRHQDFSRAAHVDVRPRIPGTYQIKFKLEALPLRDRLGGYRLLYSHSAQFGLSQVAAGDRTSMSTVARTFPALEPLRRTASEKVELVNRVVVEEVLQDLGTLDFGKDVTADCSVALWRTRGDHKLLIGEFTFQRKFRRGCELHEKVKERCRQFFIALQKIGPDWVSLGTTKTATVYRLKGNPPQAHE